MEECLRYLRMSFVQKEEGLRKAEQHDQVDYPESEHVAGDHGKYHCHKGTCETNCSGEEHEQEPTGWYGEDKNCLFGVRVADYAEWNASEQEEIGQ